MKKAITLIGLLLNIVYCSLAFSAALTGIVVGVIDGDTITVLDTNNVQHRIRLSGIDAPEKRQPFGERSKQHLSVLAFSKTVTVEWNKADKYGRTLGKVLVHGVDANFEQIRSGFAWHYKQYANDQSSSDRSAYSVAEMEARSRRVGLWQDSRPIPPWDFRHGKNDPVNSGTRNSNNSCPCDGENYCTGKRGGHYCYSESGKKRYIP